MPPAIRFNDRMHVLLRRKMRRWRERKVLEEEAQARAQKQAEKQADTT